MHNSKRSVDISSASPGRGGGNTVSYTFRAEIWGGGQMSLFLKYNSNPPVSSKVECNNFTEA